MVTWGHVAPPLVASDEPARTMGTYSLTKHLGEVICEHFARNHGLSIVALRIAKPIDLDDLRWQTAPIRPQWIAFPDLVRAYQLALIAPDIGFEIVTIVGESSQQAWNLAK